MPPPDSLNATWGGTYCIVGTGIICNVYMFCWDTKTNRGRWQWRYHEQR